MRHNNVKLHQKISFSKLFNSAHVECDSTIVFMPGCSLASYSPELVMKTYEYLKESIANIGIISNCCGAPSYLINDNKFEKYYSSLEKSLEDMKIDTVITACQSCYKTIKTNSMNLKVISLWEKLDRLGVPHNVKDIYKNNNLKITIHDSCPTKKETSIHSAIRNIAYQLGLEIEEYEQCKEKTLCCGSKSMITSGKKVGLNQMIKRSENAKTEHILTYCRSCSESLNKNSKKAIHILDFIFNKGYNTEIEDSNLFKKWINRYKCKKTNRTNTQLGEYRMLDTHARKYVMPFIDLGAKSFKSRNEC